MQEEIAAIRRLLLSWIESQDEGLIERAIERLGELLIVLANEEELPPGPFPGSRYAMPVHDRTGEGL